MIAPVLICAALVWSDGDSGHCSTPDGERHRIRLSGIDAPEVQPFTRCRQQPDIWACSPEARPWGPVATARARDLTRDGATCDVRDTDRYGRIVVTCTVNGMDLGRILVREGVAIADPRYGAASGLPTPPRFRLELSVNHG